MRMQRMRSWCACALLAALPLAVVAVPQLAQASDRPWADGVKEDDQRAALALFQEGNALLKDSAYIPAAAKYREALKLWDHPAIHYNLVLALVNLDQPIEERQHLEAAMRYGAAPIDEEKLVQAKRYMVLVEKQLSKLRISCDEPGALVTLDGRTLFNAPGKFEDFVRSGSHAVVAAKDGFVTNTVSRDFPGGQTIDLDLKLISSADATEYRRRFAQWIPWTVLGSGVLVGAVGGLLHFEGIQNVNQYNSAASASSCIPNGCVPNSSVAGYKSNGATLQGAAMAFYGVGAAAATTGLVLLYVNRLQPYQPADPTKRVEVSLLPVFGPGLGGFSASLRY